MRLVLRILGTDVAEIEVGRHSADAPAEFGPGATSADLSTSPVAFGFGASSPHDEPIELE